MFKQATAFEIFDLKLRQLNRHRNESKREVSDDPQIANKDEHLKDPFEILNKPRHRRVKSHVDNPLPIQPETTQADQLERSVTLKKLPEYGPITLVRGTVPKMISLKSVPAKIYVLCVSPNHLIRCSCLVDMEAFAKSAQFLFLKNQTFAHFAEK